MKTNLFFSVILSILVLSSCNSYDYLPKQEEVKTNGLGSYIEIEVQRQVNSNSQNDSAQSVLSKLDELLSLEEYKAEYSYFQGELIAVDSMYIYVLNEQDSAGPVCLAIERLSVSSYELQTAQPNTSYWTIPVYSLSTLSHGWIATLTLPINLVLTSATQTRVVVDSKLPYSQVDWLQLSKYARFPQGFPPSLALEQIK